VRSFLEKPLSKLHEMVPPNQIPAGTLESLAKVNPKNLFVAVTALNEQNEPHVVAGFQFQGASSGVDQLLAPLKDMLHQEMPAGKSDLVAYQGHSIETFEAGADKTLASVYLNDWYFVSNDLVALKASIDRFDHRAPGATVSLDHEPDFEAVTAKLPGAYESFIFARTQPFLKKMFDLAAASGQQQDPEAVAEAEKMRAVGATTSIENGKMHDVMYSLAPGLKQPPALQMSSLALTSADTLFYAAGVLNLPEHYKAPSLPNTPGLASVPWLQMVNGFFAQLQSSGVTYDAFLAAFGKECGVDLEWPANSAQPTLLLSLDVRDQAAAEKMVTSLTATPMGDAVWQVHKAAKAGLPVHTLSIPNMDSIRPTLLVTPKEAIFGLSAESVEQAAEGADSAHPNFTQNEPYKTAAGEIPKANVAFGYLDNRAFFERVYGIVKPAAMLGAAFLFPQANDYVDLAKLPAAEVISKHLSPTVFSETLDAQGALAESTGTVTMGQGLIFLSAAAGAAAVPFIQSQMPGLLQGVVPSAGAGAAAPAPGPLPPNPSPSASASPQPGGNQ
jgi:hypothetical protein